LIGTDPFFNGRSGHLAALAIRLAVPAIYQYREFAAAGGLMSYGSSLAGIGLEARRLDTGDRAGLVALGGAAGNAGGADDVTRRGSDQHATPGLVTMRPSLAAASMVKNCGVLAARAASVRRRPQHPCVLANPPPFLFKNLSELRIGWLIENARLAISRVLTGYQAARRS
jgi:hypothetical protein